MFGIGLISALCFLVGFVIAVKTSLIIQLISAIAGILYCNTWAIRSMELGALIPMFWVGCFIVGMSIGDLYYLIAFVPNVGEMVLNAVAWMFKP